MLLFDHKHLQSYDAQSSEHLLQQGLQQMADRTTRASNPLQTL